MKRIVPQLREGTVEADLGQILILDHLQMPFLKGVDIFVGIVHHAFHNALLNGGEAVAGSLSLCLAQTVAPEEGSQGFQRHGHQLAGGGLGDEAHGVQIDGERAFFGLNAEGQIVVDALEAHDLRRLGAIQTVELVQLMAVCVAADVIQGLEVCGGSEKIRVLHGAAVHFMKERGVFCDVQQVFSLGVGHKGAVHLLAVHIHLHGVGGGDLVRYPQHLCHSGHGAVALINVAVLDPSSLVDVIFLGPFTHL